MAEGGSFLNPRVGEPNRRAFLDLDRRVSQLAEDLTAGDVSFAGNVEIDGTLTANHIHGNLAGAVYLHVKNTSGVTIPAGSPVYATGSVGASGETEVARSECDVPSTMPALGVLQTALGNNGEGHVTVLGVAKQLDTSAWSVNDSLYVSASGTLTNVRPTGASELVQKIGRVIRSDANTGEVLVLGAGRSNDVPNGLSPTITLAGDASGSVTLTELGSGTLTVTVVDDSHAHSYLPLSGGTVTGQTTFSATDGVKLTGPSGGVWWDDRNGDGSKWVMYHSGNMIGLWNGTFTPWMLTDSGTVQIESGDSSYTRYGPNASWGGYLYVGATTDKAGTSAAAVISTDGNLHLDVADGKTMYLNFYSQGRPINSYGDWNTNGYHITTNILTATGRIYPQNWIEFSEYEGLYSPLNSAHFHPNDRTYGSWRIRGNRNNYNGISFDHNNGYTTFMVRQSDGLAGIYNNGRWIMYGEYGSHTRLYYAGGEKMRTTSYGIHVLNEVTAVNKFNSYLNHNQQWWGAGLLANPGGGRATLALHPGGVAPQLISVQNDGTVYLRNSVDTGYRALAAVIYNQSSRHLKQDIVPFPAKITSPAGSAVNEEYFPNAVDLITKLRPVFFRWKREQDLDQVPMGRRRDALVRLQKYRERKGLDWYDGPDMYHECGRDCEGSELEPCLRVRNWQNGKIGLIAQEVAEVVPECANLGSETGGYESLDSTALSALCIAALQEINNRLTLLEA